MRIQLSDHFTYRKLLRFTMPTVLMLVCTSMYSVVDGFFVSNFVGKTSFAAVNLIFPVSMGVAAIGFMLGTGGSAVVAKTIGEGKQELAHQYFSMIIYVGVALSVVFSAVCFIFMPQGLLTLCLTMCSLRSFSGGLPGLHWPLGWARSWAGLRL